MKRITLVIAMLIFMSSQAQDLPKNRIGISQGADVFNLFRGGKTLGDGTQRNPEALDYRGRVFITDAHYEFGFYVEYFPKIDFTSIGMDLAYPIHFMNLIGSSDLNVNIGMEAALVFRDLEVPFKTNKETFNYSYNTRLRLTDLFRTPLFVELLANLTYREDIIYFWGREALPNGYFPALWEGRSLYFSVGFHFN